MVSGFLLFSGFNYRAIVALCRVFTKSKVPFCIISTKDDLIYKTTYSKNIIYERKGLELELQEVNLAIHTCLIESEINQFTICPTSEFLNTFLLKNRQNIENDNVKIPLVSEETYSILTNKKSLLNTFCDNRSLYEPTEYDLLEAKHHLPLVAKPYYNIKNELTYYPQMLFNRDQWDSFATNYELADFFFQKYVDGQSYYLCYYITRENRSVHKYVQKNLLQQPDGKSIVYAKCCSVPSQVDSGIIEQKLLEMDFYGWIMFEIIIDSDDCVFLIEANPRCWGPLWLALAANKSLFEGFVYDFCRVCIDLQSNNTRDEYVWYGGMQGNLINYRRYGLTFKEINNYTSKFAELDVYNLPDTEELFRFENQEKINSTSIK